MLSLTQTTIIFLGQMSTLSFLVPESLHRQINELAEREGVSVDQLAITAFGEKVAALMSPDYLDQRALRSSRSKFEGALAKVKNVEPEEQDKL